ncbi:MAG: electron transfer flavoprotein subunit beta/FixA family protein [Bacillota bacterium]
MKVAILVKHVPDTETRIQVKPGDRKINEEGVTYIVSPFDEFAMEEALLLRERLGDVQITAVTLGPQKATEALRTCLALGADDAILVSDPAFEGADPYVTAKALAAALKGGNYDLILAGKQAVDDDAAYVGTAVAEFLDLPVVNLVTKLEVNRAAGTAVASRDLDGYSQVLEVKLPAVFTAQKGLNNPRLPALMGIMKAKKKEIKVLNAQTLGLAPNEIGAEGAKVEVKEMFVPSKARKNRVLTGAPAETAPELVRLLAEEAKVL